MTGRTWWTEYIPWQRESEIIQPLFQDREWDMKERDHITLFLPNPILWFISKNKQNCSFIFLQMIKRSTVCSQRNWRSFEREFWTQDLDGVNETIQYKNQDTGRGSQLHRELMTATDVEAGRERESHLLVSLECLTRLRLGLEKKKAMEEN